MDVFLLKSKIHRHMVTAALTIMSYAVVGKKAAKNGKHAP